LSTSLVLLLVVNPQPCGYLQQQQQQQQQQNCHVV
jgi:hypothetical protein